MSQDTKGTHTLRNFRKKTLLVTIMLTSGFAFWFGMRLREPTQTLNLMVQENFLKLGDVWECNHLKWQLPIENSGQEDVNIDGFTTSCGCAKVSPQTLTIKKGSVANVTLDLNLTDNSDQTEPWDLKVRVSPIIKERYPFAASWLVSGRVLRAFEFTPSFLNFGSSLVKNAPFLSKKVLIKSFAPLVALELKNDSAIATMSVKKTGERAYEMVITPSTNLPIGFFDFAITIKAKTLDGKSVTGSVPIYGRVLEDIQVYPSRLDIGAIALGSIAERTVVVESLLKQNLEIESVCASSPNTSVIIGQASGRRPEFTIRTRISTTGIVVGDIKLNLRDDNNLVRIVRVPLSYVGVAMKAD